MKKIISCLIAVMCYGSLQAQELQGFFLDGFVEKHMITPAGIPMDKPFAQATSTLFIDAKDTVARVSPYIYGNNANVYMSQMVNEDKLLKHITQLSPHVIRFPGGNLSSLYFWNAERGNLPADVPEKLLDENGNEYDNFAWYGKNNESWTLSVDNYYQMLEMTGNTGMITINYSYARYSTAGNPVASAAHYAAEWVRYDNGRTRYWEIGNENHGPWQAGYRIDTENNQDGQPEIINGEIYGKHFLVFADSMRKAAAEIGATIYIGGQMIHYDAANSWIVPERTWNQKFLQAAGDAADFFIAHSYYTPFNENSTPTTILNSGTDETRSMMQYLQTTVPAMGREMKPVALTEWNIFAEGSKQSCSFVNGMHATIVLAELIKNQYGMSSRWNFANGYDNGNDHGMFNQGDEPGNIPQWNPRPVFFYMYYFQRLFGDHMVNASIDGNNDLLGYASTFSSGQLGLVLINKSTSNEVVTIDVGNFKVGDKYYVFSLTGGSDNGQFSQQVWVNGNAPDHATGGPVNNLEEIEAQEFTIGNGIRITSPARSVQYVLVENGLNEIVSTQPEEKSSLTIYPNPASQEILIEGDLSGYDILTIQEITGKVVHQQAIANQIPLKLKSGIYLIKFSGQNKSIMKELVVIN